MRRASIWQVIGLVLLIGALSAPAAAEEPVDERLPSRVVLLSSHSAPVKTWSPMEVHVRIEAEDGAPLAGRNLRIWDDSYVRWRCCGPPPWRTTDANGEVRAVLHLDGNSVNPVRVAAYWHGDTTYKKAIVEWYQPMVGYDTTLDVTHAAERTSGETLPVTLSVLRTEPATECLDGAVVQVALTGPTTLSATGVVEDDPFSHACSATVEFALNVTPGRYALTATTGHEGWDRTDEPSTYAGYVDVKWQFVYDDAAGRGTVSLNLPTKEYRVVLADGRDSGIRYAGSDLYRTGVTGSVNVWRIDLNHTDGEDSAVGAFYSTGNFSARGRLAAGDWELGR